MSYDEIVKQQFENKYNIVQENLLKKDTLFPSVSDRTKYLDSGRTLILQLLFTLKVGFLEEFTTIFSFVYSKHTFEKLILSLEEEDWIISKPSKAFGKAFILSENALHFIYTKSNGTNGENAAKGKFPLDSFPSDKKLKAHKLLNGMVARQSQKVLLDLINTHFHEFPKDKRKEYTQGQFLINYVYPSNKTTLTFTKKDVALFLEGAMKELNENEELYARYLAFVKEMKKSLVSDTMDDYQIVYNFYRDFINLVLKDKECAIALLRSSLSFTNNFIRTNPFLFWHEIYKCSNEAKSLKVDFLRFYNEELLRNYTIIKRNLQNTKSNDEEQLAQNLLKIKELEEAIKRCEEAKDKHQRYFEAMTFKAYNEQDLQTFEEREINLDTLKKNNCFISHIQKMENEKPIITFAILDDAIDELQTSILFKRLEYIFLYCRKHLVTFDYNIVLYTYKKSDVPLLKEKLRLVTQQFSDFVNYSLLKDKLYELRIIPLELHPCERYQVMQALQKQKGF